MKIKMVLPYTDNVLHRKRYYLLNKFIDLDFEIDTVSSELAPIVLSQNSGKKLRFFNSINNSEYIHFQNDLIKKNISTILKDKINLTFDEKIEVRFFNNKFYYKCFFVNTVLDFFADKLEFEYIPVTEENIYNYFNKCKSPFYEKILNGIIKYDLNNIFNRSFFINSENKNNNDFKKNYLLKNFSEFIFKKRFYYNDMISINNIYYLYNSDFLHKKEKINPNIYNKGNIFYSNIEILEDLSKKIIHDNFIFINNELWCSGYEPLLVDYNFRKNNKQFIHIPNNNIDLFETYIYDKDIISCFKTDISIYKNQNTKKYNLYTFEDNLKIDFFVNHSFFNRTQIELLVYCLLYNIINNIIKDFPVEYYNESFILSYVKILNSFDDRDIEEVFNEIEKNYSILNIIKHNFINLKRDIINFSGENIYLYNIYEHAKKLWEERNIYF